MRDDMAKVIVERPRIPAFNCRKGRPQALDDLPAHEGMRRSHALRGDRKELNENLTPLRRYLERQVGRPWDKVYSEIAAHLRMDNTVQQHLRDFVAVTPRRAIGGWRSRASGLWYQRLYVDPFTGLLCRTDQLPEEKARRRRMRLRPSSPVDRIALTDDPELRRVRGVWYEVCLVPLPSPDYRSCHETQKRPLKPYDRRSPIIEVDVTVRRLATPAVRDVVTNVLIEAGPPIDDEAGWNAYRRAQPDCRYAIGKRTLSSRELRRHGLSNLPVDISLVRNQVTL
jgi:hypothetical protein